MPARKRKPIRFHSFMGKRYAVCADIHVFGYTSNEGDGREIYVDADLRGRKHLEIAIHEAQHGCFPKMSEDDVARSAKDIERFLTRLGYRRTHA